MQHLTKYDYDQSPNSSPIAPGQVWRRVGDVDVVGGTEHVCVRVTESSAVYIRKSAGQQKHVVVKNRITGEVEREFDAVEGTGATVRVSPSRDRLDKPVHRLTREQFEDFVAPKKASKARSEQPEEAEKEEDSMAKNKSERKPRGGLAAAKRKSGAKSKSTDGKAGKLGEYHEQSWTSVIRLLGKRKVSVGHVREIMKAQGVKASDTTVQIQVAAGRNGKTAGKDGKPVHYAELTDAQYEKLLKSAPDPAEVKAEEKKEAAKAA